MELSQRLDLGALVEETEEQDLSVEERLVTLVSKLSDADITPDKTLPRLGVTSLDRIELAVRIEEEFGVPTSEDLYDGEPTIAELAERIAKRTPSR
ncbi:acyl carrier protein [Corynebacterium sanguinis]|uniref:acyl carrier protein n=1 Tax=Corynebacterium TaxID=1716 RepID=UPI0011A62ED8|nr:MULTISPECIES: acyl carrier protein [Corynebacterium]MCT1556394.1 acyl carrier protein [Corynebacterium sanguinis]MCT1585725.1 acyl carrier protein [Corynebacterium sanguinis]MCT1665071.1 acyl carrier protein [Corynebacterium sanguinis]MCT2024228.1 acyl carrier protein [Corynebacterium sanguinis]MCT2047603.1 acyl carrier protein [Corynebacterium sanguinis]